MNTTRIFSFNKYLQFIVLSTTERLVIQPLDQIGAYQVI